MMPFNKECTKFSDFFKIAYKAATAEPYAKQFNNVSANGDREGMIKVLLDISCINNIKICVSYRGKDDIKATELHKKSRATVDKNGMMHDGQDKSSNLSETLFTASVPSRLFLDALLDCAKYCYNSKAFVKCLKYCECMLALPENFYNKSVESMNNFLEYKNACIQLERECFKKLKMSSSQDKKLRRKCNDNPRISCKNKLIPNHIPSVPVVDGKQHTILKSCSDAVTLQFDEERGRRLVATRNIKPGYILIVERPFTFSTNHEALIKNCLHCHVTVTSNDSIKIPCYFCQTVSSSNNSNLSLPFNIGKVFYCSEKCRGEAWKSYHQYECSVFDAFYENDSEQLQQHTSHLLLAYRMTIAGFLSSSIETINNDAGKSGTTFLNDNFLQHHVSNTDRGPNNLGIEEAYSSHDYRTILNLETHCAETEPNENLIRAIEAIFLAKCLTYVLSKNDVVCLRETFISLAVATLHHLQALNCNAYEIVENVYDKNAHVWEPRVVGGAIYPSVSLINHSCYPNIVRHTYPSGVVVVRTLHFIGKGTEILDCYGPHWLSDERLARREYLWKKYRFWCSCEACSQNWKYPLADTMNYKCRSCSENIATIALNDNSHGALNHKCSNCSEKIDYKRIKNQLRTSVEKRLNAICKMYEGDYENALPLLLEHIQFIEKFFTAPNMETIKTQQCIIQCYNQFGCTSQ